MPYTLAAKAVMLDPLRLAISHVSLHSGPPSAANELPGPAYTRQRIELTKPVNGAIFTIGAGAMFSIPAGARVTHAGFWNASKGGVLLATARAPKEEFYERAGGYRVTSARLDLNSGEESGTLSFEVANVK